MHGLWKTRVGAQDLTRRLRGTSNLNNIIQMAKDPRAPQRALRVAAESVGEVRPDAILLLGELVRVARRQARAVVEPAPGVPICHCILGAMRERERTQG